ncbi:MAG: 50S ribosomal protein L34e [Asgard group archaeon]|nr:50S ribosomal protein L34e [Asgard group archaeon]
MKPSQRFAKKVWRKPPKEDSKGKTIPKKTGKTRCALCNAHINSAKRNLARRNYKPAKSTIRPNRPYGGYLCTKCLRIQIIKEARAQATKE